MDRSDPPSHWDREADVVVIGSGATGLPAAIVAREAGASVIIIETQLHIGGHAITSGGNLPLGGGTSYQKKYGVEYRKYWFNESTGKIFCLCHAPNAEAARAFLKELKTPMAQAAFKEAGLQPIK